MVKKLIIFGAGDFSREIMYAARENKKETFETVAFVVVEHSDSKIGEKFDGIEIMSLKDATKRFDVVRRQHIKDFIPEVWEIMDQDYYNVLDISKQSN